MQKKFQPEISVIMATYNRDRFIKAALDSIINQSFTNWECLVIDDGSSDRTAEILEAYNGADSRIKYFKRSKNYRKGLPGCRNMGLDLAKGNYIQFFDDDDIVHPENLQTCFKLLKDKDLYFCRYEKKPFLEKAEILNFPISGKIKIQKIGDTDIDNVVTGKIPFASCTVLWDRKCFRNIRFNEDLMYAEEWECYTKILSEGYDGISLNQVLYFNRKHAESNTGEFWNKDEMRIGSYKKAAMLIIDQLAKKKLINDELKKFFIRLGFMLGSGKILRRILSATGAGKFEKLKYLMGFNVYPILKPLFRLKGKLLKI
ncbi:glycosyltransferase family 2 protein [Christiangramia sp. ASW11-125]|uniref:glycosyltransferase family 2 protein n=1 Tax=Christiangramia sp. ASW11-125 TaxID=3400701 RepID=UPI003AB0631A